ncbi:hypothetical protein [Hymenobacter sp. GOD-10R]|uniref:hypothetical protein n=1 Tax=Hymenobacter sp. GOD-10R TaxID=3093922 RepID=UPI002D79C7E6|nr:hypothetical protein [Hymenobacter sp. GOD-10R]WRQ30999.1 hypothetical protein SD425_12085 [Hymenobacter sp. GOD-10R]
MKFLVLALLLQQPAPVDDPVPHLIQERETLVRQYEEANAQRNSLFGNKPSKKDLQEVVDALKGIIRKDSELIQAVKESGIRRTAGIVAEKTQAERQASLAQGDQSSTRERFYDLQNQIQDLELRDKQRQKKLAEAQEQLATADATRTSRELIAVALALLSASLLVYVYRLRQKLPVRRARRG